MPNKAQISFILTLTATLCYSTSALAQNVVINEEPGNIRFEQYTGASGNINFWRLPSPGSSTFPGSTCKTLRIPSDKSEHASRFMALYLFAKTNQKKIFYYFSPSTCTIASFGMDG